jgi:riboflavin kinase/FMN adenylyltransferase
MKAYNQSNIPLAKNLRKNMTPWERKLWYDYLRYYPVRFQWQKSIGEYIVDFYCAKARLVIELDGGGHYEPSQQKADVVRTQNLQKMDLTVLRICNLDIDRNFSGVCEHIDAVVQDSLPQSASLTAPSTEGALNDAPYTKVIYALGFFDGVHLGHQALIWKCCLLAEQYKCFAGAVTFTSHPDSLTSEKSPMLINAYKERKRLLRHYGINAIMPLAFDENLRGKSWREFLEDLLINDAAGFVCGEDFRFGYLGEGTAETLADFCRERNLPYAIVPDQKLDGIRVSSTYIRQLLEAGKMEEAVRFLGHPHVLTGTVISGRKLGRTLGIPTANLAIPAGVICPKHGVYACKAIVDGQRYLAVTNIGNRPTVGGHHTTVEPWLLDFAGDLYGKELTLEFYAYLRPEQTFPSLDALQAEIRKNAVETRKFFQNK